MEYSINEQKFNSLLTNYNIECIDSKCPNEYEELQYKIDVGVVYLLGEIVNYVRPYLHKMVKESENLGEFMETVCKEMKSCIESCQKFAKNNPTEMNIVCAASLIMTFATLCHSIWTWGKINKLSEESKKELKDIDKRLKSIKTSIDNLMKRIKIIENSATGDEFTSEVLQFQVIHSQVVNELDRFLNDLKAMRKHISKVKSQTKLSGTLETIGGMAIIGGAIMAGSWTIGASGTLCLVGGVLEFISSKKLGDALIKIDELKNELSDLMNELGAVKKKLDEQIGKNLSKKDDTTIKTLKFIRRVIETSEEDIEKMKQAKEEEFEQLRSNFCNNCSTISELLCQLSILKKADESQMMLIQGFNNQLRKLEVKFNDICTNR